MQCRFLGSFLEDEGLFGVLSPIERRDLRAYWQPRIKGDQGSHSHTQQFIIVQVETEEKRGGGKGIHDEKDGENSVKNSSFLKEVRMSVKTGERKEKEEKEKEEGDSKEWDVLRVFFFFAFVGLPSVRNPRRTMQTMTRKEYHDLKEYSEPPPSSSSSSSYSSYSSFLSGRPLAVEWGGMQLPDFIIE
jgi:hypothetical protein